MSARGHKRTFLLQDGVSAKSGHCGADRYSIFCLEIAQNEVGNNRRDDEQQRES